MTGEGIRARSPDILIELSAFDTEKKNKKKTETGAFQDSASPTAGGVTRRLQRRSLRLPTRRKWVHSGYLCTTPSTAQAGAMQGFLGLKVGGGGS